MAKITFLGGEETGNVAFVDWGRFRFHLNQAVECDDRHIIAKAGTNRFFRVGGAAPDAPVPAGKVKVEVPPDEPLPLADLIAAAEGQGEKIPFFKFRADAKKHLGDEMPVPANKETILEALKALAPEGDE